MNSMRCPSCKYKLEKGDECEFGLIYVCCPKCGSHLPLGKLLLYSLTLTFNGKKSSKGVW